ncbi:uncharacterized protein PRCAT00001184001 [Priceomyces carsonii]|uniref:uncharacterized protein n=1 Tax=Priceomyces carsonii TaxID=28549 RepID=UPI002EDAE7EB|nr:unnamed protein product [Priceomyces carsonii]
MSDLPELRDRPFVRPAASDDTSSNFESVVDSDEDYESDYDSAYFMTAQEQWDTSMREITGLINMILFPLIGKLLGRRFSHIVWRKFANWWYV